MAYIVQPDAVVPLVATLVVVRNPVLVEAGAPTQKFVADTVVPRVFTQDMGAAGGSGAVAPTTGQIWPRKGSLTP